MTAHPGGSHTFLGEEFLTWLWFRVETAGGEFQLADGRALAVAVDDYLAFAPRDDDETEHTLRKGMPTRSREAQAALRNGRRLRKAKLIVAEGPAQWSVTLDGQNMGLSGIRLPEDSEEIDSTEQRSAERAAGFFALQERIGALYELFLDQRLRRDYLQRRAEQQARWMAGG